MTLYGGGAWKRQAGIMGCGGAECEKKKGRNSERSSVCSLSPETQAGTVGGMEDTLPLVPHPLLQRPPTRAVVK